MQIDEYRPYVTAQGNQVVFDLFTSGYPAGELDVMLDFNYVTNNVQFQDVEFGGSSAVQVDSQFEIIDGEGHGGVVISASVTPDTDEPLVSLVFAGEGQGGLDIDISRFAINGQDVQLTDPSPYYYTLDGGVEPPDDSPDPGDDSPVRPPILDTTLDDLPRADLSFTGLERSYTDFLTGVYVAAFDRAPDFEGLQYWADQLNHHRDGGLSDPDAFKALARDMYHAGEANGEAGSHLSNAEYVDFVYSTVLGRQPDPDGERHWTDSLDSGAIPRSEFLTVFLNSALQAEGDSEYVMSRIAVAELATLAEHSAPDEFLLGLDNVLNGVGDPVSAYAIIDAFIPGALSGSAMTDATQADFDWLAATTAAAPVSDDGPASAPISGPLNVLGTVDVPDDVAILHG